MSYAKLLLKSLARRFSAAPAAEPLREQPLQAAAAQNIGAALGVAPSAGAIAAAARSPFPAKDNLFKRLLACGIPISEVVDVGVREGTVELVVNFPKLKHHLFEPEKAFFRHVAENYKNIDHVLYHKALGSRNERRYLVTTSLEKNGQPTHSAICATRPAVIDGREVLAAEEFRIERFDSLGIEMAKNSLLKIDVDGLDTEVLAGFGEKLKLASVVVIESTLPFMVERMNLLQAAGFALIDIVDIAYYGPSLYQLDLCFLRNDLLSDALRPDITRFKGALWTQIG